jgi:hypothetical protein
MTPGDYATLTEEMEHLGTQDYMGAKSWRGINDDDDENHYPFPLVRILSLLSSLPPYLPSFPLTTSHQSLLHPPHPSTPRSPRFARRLKLIIRS